MCECVWYTGESVCGVQECVHGIHVCGCMFVWGEDACVRCSVCLRWRECVCVCVCVCVGVCVCE